MSGKEEFSGGTGEHLQLNTERDSRGVKQGLCGLWHGQEGVG